jgi:hypothetical protein
MAPLAPPAAQFSPGQILEAGRRAENDGRVGYAIQFYRHLTDHHGWSPEAAIAKEALTRLSNFRPTGEATSGGPANGQPMPQHAPPPQTWAQPPQGGPLAQVPVAPGYGSQVPGQGQVNSARPHAPMVQPARGAFAIGQAAAAPSTSDAPLPLRLPEPERRYRIGTVVAWLLFGIGLILMIAGLAFLALHAIGLKLPGALGTILGFTGGMPGALAIFAVGVTQVFAAQIGRALFDNANATRDLAMIERAKIAHAAGDRPFNDEDEPA